MLNLMISELRSISKEINIDGYKNMSKTNSKVYLLNYKDLKCSYLYQGLESLCPYNDLYLQQELKNLYIRKRKL